jgi:hypothetical protein
MHNCGCYHLFFPTNHIIPRVLTGNQEKPVLLPDLIPDISSGDIVVIRLASGTHYLQRVNVTGTTGSSIRYTLANYKELRSIALPSGHNRSMFGPDGLVTGTERKERWILWPMGIPAPGSMRQWGHHATAFVGKRHFDDPDLLDRYFKRTER